MTRVSAVRYAIASSAEPTNTILWPSTTTASALGMAASAVYTWPPARIKSAASTGAGNSIAGSNSAANAVPRV